MEPTAKEYMQKVIDVFNAGVADETTTFIMTIIVSAEADRVQWGGDVSYAKVLGLLDLARQELLKDHAASQKDDKAA